MQFCEAYLCSVASREVADFKSTAESQLQHFTAFEVITCEVIIMSYNYFL